MFTGIVETTGTIKHIVEQGNNRQFWIDCPLVHDLKIDQSVSHEGVCLTVDAKRDGLYRVTAIEETLAKTNLTEWKENTIVNIERCMQLNGRLDGHIVQGHVDGTAVCTATQQKEGSTEFVFSYDRRFVHLLIEKGSVCVNGTSLTCFDLKENTFKVAIIPYTFEHTSISTVMIGTAVNIEFDVIGKYLARMADAALKR